MVSCLWVQFYLREALPTELLPAQTAPQGNGFINLELGLPGPRPNLQSGVRGSWQLAPDIWGVAQLDGSSAGLSASTLSCEGLTVPQDLEPQALRGGGGGVVGDGACGMHVVRALHHVLLEIFCNRKSPKILTNSKICCAL